MLKIRLKKILATCILLILIGKSASFNGVNTYAMEATSTISDTTEGTATTSTTTVTTTTSTIGTTTSKLATTYTDSQGVTYNLDNTNETASVAGVNSKDIKTVELPKEINVNGQTYSVTSIYSCAFYGCSDLSSIVISNSITSISNWAFEGCSSLISIAIPNSVTSIGNLSFNGCTGLTSIIVDDNNKFYSSQDGVLFNKDKTNLIIYLEGNRQSEYTIPDSVTSIGDFAFSWSRYLSNVRISEGVKSVGSYAFSCCSGLESINVDANNKNYSSEDGVFFNKDKTELIQYPLGNKQSEYTVPDSVTSVVVKHYCNTLT